MPKWEARVTFILFNNKSCYDIPCSVIFIDDGEELVISFKEGGLAKDDEITFHGKRIGDGHWKLSSDDDDIATLHMFPDDYFLEGYLLWDEEGGKMKRMWRIELLNLI